jgi:tRNA(Ile)-lysidine synthase
MNNQFLDQVKKMMKNLTIYNCSILLGISGGVDSMALLSILLTLKNEFNLELYGAYVNHNLRKDESTAEEQFVVEQMEKQGVPLSIKKIHPDYWTKLKKLSVEMAARKVRYQFFQKTALELEIDYIATAHHLNDRIETFFLQLFRAGGIETLKSIPIKNKKIIRPLLNITRKEILDYVREQSIPYFEDSSNNQNMYQRNRVRNSLIPVFCEIYPHYEKSFRHLFQFLQEDQAIMKHFILYFFKKMLCYQNDHAVCINKKLYQQTDRIIQKKIIKLIIKKLHYPAQFSLVLFDQLCGIKNRYCYHKNQFFCTDSGNYIYFCHQKKLSENTVQLQIDQVPFFYTDKTIEIKLYQQKNVNPIDQTAFCSSDVPFPIVIRSLKDNDQIRINNKNKRIKTILKEKHIPGIFQNDTKVIHTQNKNIIGFVHPNLTRISQLFYVQKSKTTNFIIEIQ